jgi:hypothetical protein
MIYEFRCQGKCGRLSTVGIKLEEYDIVKRSIKCCGKPMEREFSPPTIVFARESFPKGTEITEHCMDEPVYCKDKKQLEDICAESNSVSRYLEDDV